MNDRNRARFLPVVRASAILLGLSASAFVACDSDGDDTDDPEGDPADCRVIANRCHPYDSESELAAECHEVGHDGASPAKCTEMRARCLDECPPLPDSGTGGSSGSSSGGTSNGGTSSGGTPSTGGAAGSSTGGSATGGSATGGSATGGSATGGSATGGAGGAPGGSSGASPGGRAGSGGSPGGRAGSGGSGGTGETACETLGRVCHDGTGGTAEECHELGHDGEEPACEARFTECLAACT